MLTLTSLLKVSSSLENEILITKEDCLSKFPIDTYIENITNYPEISSYGYISHDVMRFSNDLISYTNSYVLDLFHRLTLVYLIIQAIQNHLLKNFPDDIRLLYHKNFERIVNEIESRSFEETYTYANDKFRKDIAVCSLKMIPAGAQKIHIHGLSKRFMFKRGLRQFIKSVAFLITELGGFSPLFEMHTDSNDPQLMSEFNEEGWLLFYKRVSEIMKTYPNVKGVFGSSWFFDPDLDNISPRLAYLRNIPTSNGGKLFYIGSNEQSIKDATLKSPTRKRLYQENKYIPTSYLLIWSRQKLVCWARDNNKKL